MERRLAITYIVSATTTFGVGCVAIAAASGGLFVSAAPKSTGGKQLELVDEYVVLRSSTSVPTIETAAPTLDITAALVPASPLAAAIAAKPVATQAAVSGAAAQPDVTVAALPTPETAPAPAPTPESAPTPEPAPATPSAPIPAPAAPTTMAPKPITTTAPPAAVPSGARIPNDWPANKPIPPIPPGCEKPQLEDNGKWNCE